MTGKNLQEWRRAHGLTTKHIADAIGASYRTVETWESTGHIPERKVKKLEALMRNEVVALRINRDLFLRLEARAREKGYVNADAYATELFEKFT